LAGAELAQTLMDSSWFTSIHFFVKLYFAAAIFGKQFKFICFESKVKFNRDNKESNFKAANTHRAICKNEDWMKGSSPVVRMLA
jgi:hypothetical protein